MRRQMGARGGWAEGGNSAALQWRSRHGASSCVIHSRAQDALGEGEGQVLLGHAALHAAPSTGSGYQAEAGAMQAGGRGRPSRPGRRAGPGPGRGWGRWG